MVHVLQVINHIQAKSVDMSLGSLHVLLVAAAAVVVVFSKIIKVIGRETFYIKRILSHAK